MIKCFDFGKDIVFYASQTRSAQNESDRVGCILNTCKVCNHIRVGYERANEINCKRHLNETLEVRNF